MIWLLPLPFPPTSPVIKLDRRHTGRLNKRDNLLTGERRGGGWRGAESYDRQKAWASINHSIPYSLTLAIRLSSILRAPIVRKNGQSVYEIRKEDQAFVLSFKLAFPHPLSVTKPSWLPLFPITLDFLVSVLMAHDGSP